MNYLKPIALDHPEFGMETLSFRMRFADGSSLLRHHFIRLGFLPGWISVASPGRLEKTFDALERNLNAAAAHRGELALTIPMLCAEANRPLENK